MKGEKLSKLEEQWKKDSAYSFKICCRLLGIEVLMILFVEIYYTGMI